MILMYLPREKLRIMTWGVLKGDAFFFFICDYKGQRIPIIINNFVYCYFHRKLQNGHIKNYLFRKNFNIKLSYFLFLSFCNYLI